MTSILISMGITNITIMFMSSMTRFFNKENARKFQENNHLLRIPYLILREEGVARDVFSSNDKATEKVRYAFRRRNLFFTHRITYIDDAITDRKFLEYIKVNQKDIDEIEVNIKPYIKIEKTATDLECIATYGAIVNIILTFIKLIVILLK